MTDGFRLYGDYSRREVHDILAPGTAFTTSTGTWGLQGIVSIPDSPGDLVFFVTFGHEEGEHTFNEWVTEDGVLSWQSQPHQALDDERIRELIAHDERRNHIHLFLRTAKGIEYTYMGQLKYLWHDTRRERPVYFQWQIMAWSIPGAKVEQMGLRLRPPQAAFRQRTQADSSLSP